MRWIQKNKKFILFFGLFILIIAGLLDLIFQGLFYQLLPEPVQSYITDLF
ncbi:hypothetical protein [Bacillus sp. AK128]